MSTTIKHPEKKIRSFVCRSGRMSPRLKEALSEHSVQYGLDTYQGLLDFNTLFGNDIPVHLEIGFGMGQALLEMAQQKPSDGFIGIEVHKPGIATVFAELTARHINNVRIFTTDAVEILTKNIPDQSLTTIFILFPDPWPKRNHQKRRLIQPAFIELATQKLKVGGHLHLATDWQDYAKQMMRVLSSQAQLQNIAGEGCFLPESTSRPATKFENRGRKLGLEVFDLKFVKV